MSTSSSLFQLDNIAGYTDAPDSLLASGAIGAALPLAAIQTNTDFAVCNFELFYGEFQDGDTVPLYQSSRDGYNYQRSEQIYWWELRSTVGLDPSGQPAQPGGMQEGWWEVNQHTGDVSCSEAYYVQGGSQGNSNQGGLAVWTIAQRGRGKRKVTGTTTYTPQSTSGLTQDKALTPALLQPMNQSAKGAGLKIEAFVLNGSTATPWTANTTPAVNALWQPPYGYEDGYWYQAMEVTGPTSPNPPEWPGELGAAVVDGGVLWVAVGRGCTNGQSVPYPKSWADNYAYSNADTMILLPSWHMTGSVQAGTQISLGPSANAARIQRLQKSTTGLTVNCGTTYWNGSTQSVPGVNGFPYDGLVGIVAIFIRAFSGTVTPTASDYYEFNGGEFMGGQPPADQNLQDLATNINFARLCPEAFVTVGMAAGATVSVPTSAKDAYAYARSELYYLTIINDTGAMSGDFAIRDVIVYCDPELGTINSRIDYLKGGNPVGYFSNGSYTAVCMAFRKTETQLSGVSIIPTLGTPSPIPAGSSESIIFDGDMENWSQLTTSANQLVGLPDGWSYISSSSYAFPQQIPGLTGLPAIGGLFSLALAVAHGSGSPSTVNFIHVGSPPGAVVPGDPYSFSIQFYGHPAITDGLYINLHFRDVNQNELGYIELANNAAVGTAIGTLACKFTMPNAGDSAVSTDTLGQLAIQGGPLSTAPVYVVLEIANDRPNTDSNIIFDNLGLLHLGSETLTVSGTPATVLAPTLGTVSGGSLPSRTYYVQINYNATVQRSPVAVAHPGVLSAEASIAIPANSLLQVTAPAVAGGGWTWNIFASETTGAETQQNATAIASGTNWTEPTSGLTSTGVLAAETDQPGAIGTDGLGRHIKYLSSAGQAQTPSIQSGAVSGTLQATLASNATLSQSAWTTLASVTLEAGGGVAFITMGGSLTADAGESNLVPVVVQVYKNGSAIGASQQINVIGVSSGGAPSYPLAPSIVLDTSPGSGSVTYTLEAELTGAPSTLANVYGCGTSSGFAPCQISVINLKV